MNKIDPIILRYLELHKVDVTPSRVRVLELFISNPAAKFSHEEVLLYVKEDFPDISSSAVAHTLRLYKARTLLSEVLNERQSSSIFKRGRPKTKYVFVASTGKNNVEE